MRDAFVLLQNFEKGLTIDRVTAEFGIHHSANVVERSQGFGRQPLGTRCLLKQQKGFQNGVRVFLVKIVLGNIDQTIDLIEVLIDFSDFNAQIATRSLQIGLNVEQQYLV